MESFLAYPDYSGITLFALEPKEGTWECDSTGPIMKNPPQLAPAILKWILRIRVFWNLMNIYSF